MGAYSGSGTIDIGPGIAGYPAEVFASSVIAAGTINMNAYSKLHYTNGLASTKFTGGPGASWQIKKGTYHAIKTPPEPVKFGWTGVGDTLQGAMSRRLLSRLMPPGTYNPQLSGMVCRGKAYMKAGLATATAIYLIVYDDSGGNSPGSRIAISDPVTFDVNQPAGWVNFRFNPAFTIGTTLDNDDPWLGIFVTGNSPPSDNGPIIYASTSHQQDYDWNSENGVLGNMNSLNWYTTPPPYGGGNNSGTVRDFSAYLEVEPSCTP